jgi:hypothetical protein
VAGAYVVLFALVLIYVVIMAVRLSRIQREVNELLTRSSEPADEAPEDAVDISGAGSTAA